MYYQHTAMSRTQAVQRPALLPNRSLTNGMVNGAMVWNVEVKPPQIPVQVPSRTFCCFSPALPNWLMNPRFEVIEPFNEPGCQFGFWWWVA